MYVITRQRDETIMVGDDIEITVVSIASAAVRSAGAAVRLGITAPAGQPVHRKEVWEALRAQRPDQPRKEQP